MDKNFEKDIMFENIFSSRNKYFLQDQIIFSIVLLFCFIINLSELQIFRPYAVDEITMADVAYSVYTNSPVPKLNLWSHIFPAEGIIDFLYPPFYQYVSGFFMKMVGFYPFTLGLLHLISRMSTVTALFFFLKKLRLNNSLILVSCIWWAAFMRIGFYTTRPDDLAILFVILAQIFIIQEKHSKIYLVLTGAMLGISFLFYPVAIIIGVLLSVVLLFKQDRLDLINIFIVIGSAGAASCLWLFWIIPYWQNFNQFFLGFVLPDAGTSNYFESLWQHLETLVLGNGPVFNIQTSILPWLVLDIVVSIKLAYDKRIKISRLILLHSALIVATLFIPRNRIHPYGVNWLSITYIFTLFFLITEIDINELIRNQNFKLLLNLFIIISLLQSTSILGIQILHTYANQIYQKNCMNNPIEMIRNSITPSEKVLTQNALVFYAVREENDVYFPAGFSGVTPAGIPFDTDYDNTFTWFVVNEPLEIIENYG